MRQKTGFVVDEVSEESFYQNLLLGLTKTLESSPCVTNINLKRLRGAKETDIRNWEHNNGVLLPEELRNFYSSVNGFLFTYTFSYENTDEKLIATTGIIEINPLEGLNRTYGYETKNKGDIEKVGDKYKLSLSRDSKVFELSKIDESSKVVLIYVNSYCSSTIWLFCAPYSFNFLADNIISYFRMCIAHLGIPYWQFIVSPEGIPEWSREIFQIIAPGVLKEDKNLISNSKFDHNELNKIDTNIFVVPQMFNQSFAPSDSSKTTVSSPSHSKKKKRTNKLHGSQSKNSKRS